jgi:hypothetical protein
VKGSGQWSDLEEVREKAVLPGLRVLGSEL